MLKTEHIIYIFLTLFILSSTSCGDVKDAREVCNEFYSLRQNKNYTEMTQLCSSDFFIITSKNEMITILKEVDSKMGRLKNFKTKGFKIFTKKDITYTQFEYRVLYENGIMNDSLTLIKQNQKYKILSYSWNKKQ